MIFGTKVVKNHETAKENNHKKVSASTAGPPFETNETKNGYSQSWLLRIRFRTKRA